MAYLDSLQPNIDQLLFKTCRCFGLLWSGPAVWKHMGCNFVYRHVVHENLEDGSRKISFPLVIADSERDMTRIEPGPLVWHTSILTMQLILCGWNVFFPETLELVSYIS